MSRHSGSRHLLDTDPFPVDLDAYGCVLCPRLCGGHHANASMPMATMSPWAFAAPEEEGSDDEWQAKGDHPAQTRSCISSLTDVCHITVLYLQLSPCPSCLLLSVPLLCNAPNAMQCTHSKYDGSLRERQNHHIQLFKELPQSHPTNS